MTETKSVRSQTPDSDRLLARLVDEFSKRLEAGEPVDLELYATEHPKHADQLRRLLPAIQSLAELGCSIAEVASSSALAATSERAGPTPGILGDFRILREVGRGGMGIVYEAEQISLSRRVALKVLPFAAVLDHKQLQRFKNEATAAAHLDHPNIVHVYFVGSDRGVHFYAMQFIEGQTLGEVIRELRRASGLDGEDKSVGNGLRAVPSESAYANAASVHDDAATRNATEGVPYSGAVATTAAIATLSTERTAKPKEFFRTVARLGIQAAEALEHAHEMGVVHRDIKPSNLMLDARGNLWLTDFGLAQFQTDANLTMTGDLIGTLRYMSPEQALAKRVIIDHRTDIYSLGVTLYELLTLRPVFSGLDRQEILRQIAFDEPQPPRKTNPSIPVELETIVMKAIGKNPSERYVTAQALADDLRRFLEDRPIVARRPTLLHGMLKWSRRHRSVVRAAAATGIVAIAVVAAIIGWVAHDRAARIARTNHEIDDALNESSRFRARSMWPEAIESLRRAQSALVSGGGTDAARQRIQKLLDELNLAARLDEIRIKRASTIKNGVFDYSISDAEYSEAFLQTGVSVKQLFVGDVGNVAVSSAVREHLAAALDDWAALRRRMQKEDDLSWKQLLAAARRLDSDTWRNELREAWQNLDKEALVNRATSEKVDSLPPATTVLLADALRQVGELDLAISVLRNAQRDHPDDFWLNHHTGTFLGERGSPYLSDAVRFLAAALALRPHDYATHLKLAKGLFEQGNLPEAITTLHRAIRLKPDDAAGHCDLADILDEAGAADDAIAEYREAIRLSPDYARAYNNLGATLNDKKHDAASAILCYREVLRVEPDSTLGHYNLGTSLLDNGQLEGACAEFERTIRLRPDDPEAHCNLGSALKRRSLFADALAEYRRGHELGSRNETWRYPSAQWIEQCQRLIELDERLATAERDPALSGEEAVELAELCVVYKHLNQSAVRFYEAAFSAQPELSDNRNGHHRYNAACAAALAASGQGEDPGAPGLDDAERVRLRRQALDWLRADLAFWKEQLDGASRQPSAESAAKVRATVLGTLRNWQQDTDLASVRDEAALAKLADEERESWSKLWAEVKALIERRE